eukprot:1153816-Pelagomonas_calceolata.AAC.2
MAWEMAGILYFTNHWGVVKSRAHIAAVMHVLRNWQVSNPSATEANRETKLDNCPLWDAYAESIQN